MMCIGAALFAQIANGTYRDPQAGRIYTAGAAITAARATIRQFLAAAGPREMYRHPFPTWAELGVTVETPSS